MSIRPPSPLTDLADEVASEPTAIRAVPPPPIPQLSDFELELRRRLSILEAHQVRTDSLIIELQAEQRQRLSHLEHHMEHRLDGIALLLGELVAQVKALVERS